MLFMKRNNNLEFVYLIIALVAIDGNSNQKIVPRLCLAIVALAVIDGNNNQKIVPRLCTTIVAPVVIDGNNNMEFVYRVGKLLIYLYFRNWI